MRQKACLTPCGTFRPWVARVANAEEQVMAAELDSPEPACRAPHAWFQILLQSESESLSWRQQGPTCRGASTSSMQLKCRQEALFQWCMECDKRHADASLST